MDADRGRDPVRTGATLVLATVAVAAAVLLATSLSPVAGTGPADGPNATRVEQLVHRFANDERRERGLAPLARDPALARVARNHSAWMARTETVGHGEEPLADRYARYGLVCEGGENVYAVATVGAPYDERSLARRAVDAWIDSPGHRENLLAERFEVHGVGVATAGAAGRTTVYVTQDFC